MRSSRIREGDRQNEVAARFYIVPQQGGVNQQLLGLDAAEGEPGVSKTKQRQCQQAAAFGVEQGEQQAKQRDYQTEGADQQAGERAMQNLMIERQSVHHFHFTPEADIQIVAEYAELISSTPFAA